MLSVCVCGCDPDQLFSFASRSTRGERNTVEISLYYSRHSLHLVLFLMSCEHPQLILVKLSSTAYPTECNVNLSMHPAALLSSQPSHFGILF